MTPKVLQLPAGWTVAPLSEILLPTETWNPRHNVEGDFLYIDIEALDNEHQRVSAPKQLDCRAAPSRPATRSPMVMCFSPWFAPT